MINIQIKYMIRLYQKNKAKFKQKKDVLYGTTISWKCYIGYKMLCLL